MVSLPKTIEITGMLSLVETEAPHVLPLVLLQMSDLHTLQSSPQPNMHPNIKKIVIPIKTTHKMSNVMS